MPPGQAAEELVAHDEGLVGESGGLAEPGNGGVGGDRVRQLVESGRRREAGCDGHARAPSRACCSACDLAPHFALIRQINAEREHIPPAALALWQQTGPGRTRRELAERLRRITERGDLAIDDPARAAGHLMVLISADNLTDPGDLHDKRETRAMVTAGVRAFLYGYQS
jgi:hypothetical protein